MKRGFYLTFCQTCQSLDVLTWFWNKSLKRSAGGNKEDLCLESSVEMVT